MRTTAIIDIIVAAVLLGFLIWGARRGLFRSVAGLVIVLAALVGGGIAANTLTPVVSGALQPIIEKRVEEQVDKVLQSGGAGVVPQEPRIGGQTGGGDETALEIGNLLALLGIDQDPAGAILEKARQQVHDTGVSAATAVVESLTESILHTVLFSLSFSVILILLKLAAGVIDMALKLPGLHMANSLGGAAVGLAEGVLAVFLAVWVLRRFGVSFDTETVEQTILLQFFTTHTPLSVLSFL